MRQSIRPRAHKAGLECETVGGWLVDLLEELELQPQPGSDPSGVVSPEGGVHPWMTWCHLWVYRGLSPVGGCG
jgi:hypothetical protein